MLWYRVTILILGLSMLSTFIYSFFTFPEQSVTSNMRHYPAYLGIITGCLAGHTLAWLLYLRSYRREEEEAVYWGYLTILIQAAGWIGLITHLEGTAHAVFVAIFSAGFLTTILILCHLVYDQDLVLLLRLSVIVTLFSNILMLVLYGDPRFYIPEHLGFVSYSLFFTAFFYMQDYDTWGEYCAVDTI